MHSAAADTSDSPNGRLRVVSSGDTSSVQLLTCDLRAISNMKEADSEEAGTY